MVCVGHKNIKYLFKKRSIISDILDIAIGEVNSNIVKNIIDKQKTCEHGYKSLPRKEIRHFFTTQGMSLDTC